MADFLNNLPPSLRDELYLLQQNRKWLEEYTKNLLGFVVDPYKDDNQNKKE